MPQCKVDADRSPSFGRLVKRLERKYRRIRNDLAAAWKGIERDYTTACHATPIPNFERKVWKYRCKSQELGGASGAYRIIAFYDEESKTLYPILVYTKRDQADVPDAEITKAMLDFRQILEQDTLPLNEREEYPEI